MVLIPNLGVGVAILEEKKLEVGIDTYFIYDLPREALNKFDELPNNITWVPYIAQYLLF